MLASWHIFQTSLLFHQYHWACIFLSIPNQSVHSGPKAACPDSPPHPGRIDSVPWNLRGIDAEWNQSQSKTPLTPTVHNPHCLCLSSSKPFQSPLVTPRNLQRWVPCIFQLLVQLVQFFLNQCFSKSCVFLVSFQSGNNCFWKILFSFIIAFWGQVCVKLLSGKERIFFLAILKSCLLQALLILSP